MAYHRFIAGDWGTSLMRLHLCERNGDAVRVIDEAAGPGIKFCDDPEAAFFAAAGAWFDRDGAMPVILAGMVGSSVGWVDCPYAPCPATAADLAARMTRIEARGVTIAVVPGLRATSIFGLPDVMRGEEAQLFGWIADHVAPGPRIVCLPGTHAKWAIVEGESVTSFFTSMTGELFEILVAHSLVGRGMTPHQPGSDIASNDRGFADGLDTAVMTPTLSFEHAIFSARSRLVTGGLAADDARAYLSGLLIGCEVRDAIAAHRAHGVDPGRVALIATPQLAQLYAAALARLGVASESYAGADASLRGLATLLDATTVPA